MRQFATVTADHARGVADLDEVLSAVLIYVTHSLNGGLDSVEAPGFTVAGATVLLRTIV